jgi:hypothetical protein
VVLAKVFGIATLGVEIMVTFYPFLPILSVYTSSYPVILIIDCSPTNILVIHIYRAYFSNSCRV